jgi:hypothetical protein
MWYTTGLEKPKIEQRRRSPHFSAADAAGLINFRYFQPFGGSSTAVLSMLSGRHRSCERHSLAVPDQLICILTT